VGRLPIENPLLDNYGVFDPMNLVNPYAFAAPAGGSTVIEFASANKIDGFDVSSAGNTWSLSFWLKPQDGSGNDNIIGDRTGFTEGVHYASFENRLTMFYSGTFTALGSTGTVPTDTWAHIVISVNAGAGTAYRNGSSIFSPSSVPAFTLTGMGDGYVGRLADLAFYSIALSGTNATDLYNKTTNPTTIGSLLAYWKLDDVANGASGNGVTFADSSGNGEAGTGTGTTGRTADY
jgi:hypothetical protein